MTFYTSGSALPPLRHDISGQEIAPGTIALYDELGYTDRIARLPAELIEFLLLLDGKRTAEDLARQSAQSGRAFSVDQFVEVMNALEGAHFLDSEGFAKHREAKDRTFNDLPTRPAAHAG